MSGQILRIDQSDGMLNSPYPTKLKILGFALLIIVALGGIAAGSVGFVDFLKVGSIGQLHQVLMISAGGAGILATIVVIVQSVKYFTKSSSEQVEIIEPPKVDDSQRIAAPVPFIEAPTSKVYSHEAYKKLGSIAGLAVEIVDEVPAPPQKDMSIFPYLNKPVDEFFSLVYFPEKIRVNGVEKRLTLNTLVEISRPGSHEIHKGVLEKYGDVPVEHGWKRLSDRVFLRDLDANADDRVKIFLEHNPSGYRVVKLLEIAVFIKLYGAVHGRSIYSSDRFDTENQHFTYVLETLNNERDYTERLVAGCCLNYTAEDADQPPDTSDFLFIGWADGSKGKIRLEPPDRKGSAFVKL